MADALLSFVDEFEHTGRMCAVAPVAALSYYRLDQDIKKLAATLQTSAGK